MSKPKEVSESEIKEGMEAVFSGLFASMERETRDNYGELINNISKMNTPEDYQFNYITPIESALKEATRLKYPKVCDDNLCNMVNIYTENRFIRAHFEKVISKIEGWPCSADKSGWLIRNIYQYFATGEEIDMSLDDKEYTFMIPKFWNKHNGQEWLEFFKALICLHSGNMDYYVKFLKDYYMPLLKELENNSEPKGDQQWSNARRVQMSSLTDEAAVIKLLDRLGLSDKPKECSTGKEKAGRMLLEVFIQWNKQEGLAYIGHSGMNDLDVNLTDLTDVCLDGDFNLQRIAELFIEKSK